MQKKVEKKREKFLFINHHTLHISSAAVSKLRRLKYKIRNPNDERAESEKQDDLEYFHF